MYYGWVSSSNQIPVSVVANEACGTTVADADSDADVAFAVTVAEADVDIDISGGAVRTNMEGTEIFQAFSDLYDKNLGYAILGFDSSYNLKVDKTGAVGTSYEKFGADIKARGCRYALYGVP